MFRTKDKMHAVLFWGHLLAIAMEKIHVIVIALKKEKKKEKKSSSKSI